MSDGFPIESTKSGKSSHSTNFSKTFDREQWLQKQWEEGKTIFNVNVPHAGGGFRK